MAEGFSMSPVPPGNGWRVAPRARDDGQAGRLDLCPSHIASQLGCDGSPPGEAPEKAALVSVIVPCYNAAAFLPEALQSALQQTYPRIEILVVDDGSTDATPEVARRYPVHYIRQENRGVSAARNAGIAHSHGEFLVFLDADDRLASTGIEDGMTALEQNPHCMMAVGEHRYILEDGAPAGVSRKGPVRRDLYTMLLESNFVESVGSAIYRRDVFDREGGFDNSLDAAEDYALYLRITRRNAAVIHRAVVSEYRLHGSNTSRNSELMLRRTLEVICRERRHIEGDPGRLRAYRKGLRGWRRKYGRQLSFELARAGRPGGEGRPEGVKLLAREYPFGALMLVMLRFIPRGLVDAVCRSRPGASSNPSCPQQERPRR
jgi:glycosyltransferase involved in cell wall biosynthesis